MEELKVKLNQYAKDIVDTHVSYKKEPKRYSKNRERLLQWGKKIQDLWDLYKQTYEEIISLQDPENGTNSNESEYNAIKLYYDDMSVNVQFKLGKIKGGQDKQNETTQQQGVPEPEIEVANEEEEEEKSDIEMDFRTPIKKITVPRFAIQSEELQSIITNAVDRFHNKAKLFGKELNTIEKYIKNGLKTRARLALKDIEKMRNDLSECIEEVYFMIGIDDATEQESVYDVLVMRYRQLIEESSEAKNDELESMPLKLKPIEIPTFTGATKAWPTFSGLFKSMIIDNRKLNDVQRMQYLKTTVSGEAAKLIANMGIMDDKFEAAWNILVERFENKRAIRDAHLELLLKIPEMRFEASGELREYYDKAKESVELLNEMSAEQILLYLLMKKLPNETRKIYEQSRVNPTDEQKLTEYFEFLHKRCQVLETIEGNFRKMTKNSKINVDTAMKIMQYLCV